MKTTAKSAYGATLTVLLAAIELWLGDVVTQLRAQSSNVRGNLAISEPRKLSHNETLHWIAENKAWRLAKKIKPIWARPVEPDEVGKEFQTANHLREKAKAGYWLCVGSAGEPWFQSHEKLQSKYEPKTQETRKFEFDTKERSYRQFKPKGTVHNWVAQVKGPGIAGFFVRPGYDPESLLYSPAGGYVVKDDVSDPYRDNPKDVWLVQQSLFESTYEFIHNRKPDLTPPANR
jgi:hypothetical protein